MTPAEKLGHRARASRIQTAIGPAWLASCSCGWSGPKHWYTEARRIAGGERWRHEIDVEDGIIAPLAS